jgi:hypothetical protein
MTEVTGAPAPRADATGAPARVADSAGPLARLFYNGTPWFLPFGRAYYEAKGHLR